MREVRAEGEAAIVHQYEGEVSQCVQDVRSEPEAHRRREAQEWWKQ